MCIRDRSMRDPFKVLGIDPTSDKKQIKKAYAKLAARYHPEEYPEKWQEIHEAYEAAIQFASAIGEDAWTCLLYTSRCV